jgi:hypothetical protein
VRCKQRCSLSAKGGHHGAKGKVRGEKIKKAPAHFSVGPKDDVRSCVDFEQHVVLGASTALLSSEAVEQPVPTGAAEVALAATAIGPARGMR